MFLEIEALHFLLKILLSIWCLHRLLLWGVWIWLRLELLWLLKCWLRNKLVALILRRRLGRGSSKYVEGIIRPSCCCWRGSLLCN